MPLKDRENMAAPTFYVAENDKELIDRIIEIRKNENIKHSS